MFFSVLVLLLQWYSAHSLLSFFSLAHFHVLSLSLFSHSFCRIFRYIVLNSSLWWKRLWRLLSRFDGPDFQLRKTVTTSRILHIFVTGGVCVVFFLLFCFWVLFFTKIYFYCANWMGRNGTEWRFLNRIENIAAHSSLHPPSPLGSSFYG